MTRMRAAGAAAVFAGWSAAMAAGAVAAQAPASTQDGVYAAAQATRGKALYDDKCSACHVGDLSGGGDGMASPLAGADFLKTWDGKSLGDFFAQVQRMPMGEEKTMTDAQRADVVAYILQFNKMPAGQAELKGDPAALKPIKIAFKK
jgi:mono/diheme cytochrome c family protein